MKEELIPILRVKRGKKTAEWYTRLGFTIEGEHRFGPRMPLYLFLRRGHNALHLSEHKGDAPPKGVLYMRVENLDEVATEFGVNIAEHPWGREIELVDPDKNRLRIGECVQNVI